MQAITDSSSLQVFDTIESEVRSYCRSFPTVFTKAKGYLLWDRNGREYIDFFSGAGALNYGHNDEQMKKKILEYLSNDGITHSLDMATEAKEQFLQKFNQVILKPRQLNYKVMFPGPTGTNSVESALKLARKVTGRTLVISFTNAFHGMTLGSLSVTGNASKRQGAGLPLTYTVPMPYDGYFDGLDTIQYLERFLSDQSSGLDLPAAIILETVQGEGGLKAARLEWLQRMERLCRKWEILMIIDDIQAGCGRTGTFFSFEPANIKPDIVCLSKSISGYGLPLALTLFKPELDVWRPGEHNGTFRGNNLAFIAAIEALSYWEKPEFVQEIQRKAHFLRQYLERMLLKYPSLQGELRGRGLMQGIACRQAEIAENICREAFQRGLIMETSGPKDEVIKLFPPITIDDEGLKKGLTILEESIRSVLAKERGARDS